MATSTSEQYYTNITQMYITFEVESLITDGGSHHIPELFSYSIHHVPGGQLGLTQHPIPTRDIVGVIQSRWEIKLWKPLDGQAFIITSRV